MSVHSLVLEDLRYGLFCDLHIGEHLGASLERCTPLLPEPDRSESLRESIHSAGSCVPMAWCRCVFPSVCMLVCCKFCVLPGMIITAPIAAPATGMCALPSNFTFEVQQKSKACMIKHFFTDHPFVHEQDQSPVDLPLQESYLYQPNTCLLTTKTALAPASLRTWNISWMISWPRLYQWDTGMSGRSSPAEVQTRHCEKA
jgi:hypothetical protein